MPFHHRILLATMLPVFGAGNALAERHELGLLLGRSSPQSRTLAAGGAALDPGSGTTFYVNYGVRLLGGGGAALYFEVPFAATPQHKVGTTEGRVTRDFATLYLTPGFRLKLAPGARVSPYVAAGAGYALFEHSTRTFAGDPNSAPRRLSRGAYTFGGGVDIRAWRFVNIRGEIRDFASGGPAFNLPVEGGTQHNLLLAAGIALRF